MKVFEKEIISWEAPEYIQHEKGLKWFIAAGIVVVAFCIYAAMTQNWTLLVALVLLSAMYIWQHGDMPKNVKIVVSDAGIKIGNKVYPYQNIKSFWLIYRPPYVKTLNIRSNSKLLPDITIQLGDQDPAVLRTYLCSQIREEEGKEETAVDAIIRIFKM